jgi:sugar-specific transcriptional regulator TrmB
VSIVSLKEFMQQKPTKFELISCTEVKDPELLVKEIKQRLLIAKQKFDKYLEETKDERPRKQSNGT